MKSFEISGQIVDVVKKRIYPGKVFITNGFISKIEETDNVDNQYLIPGLIDSHIHIESSMLIPSEFARIAVLHGTVATVSDPHEIGNVLGMKGIEFMISNGKKVPFKFYFGAPSCVPATSFETTGADLGIEETAKLLEMEDIYGLAEMMNVPGVLFKDPEVMKKLELAKRKGKPIDGHAPGLVGIDAQKYIGAWISTDHECVTIGEAREKINFGMKVLIREGSAARDFEALSDLILEFPEMVMFCSDDKHPNELVEGHINLLVKRAIAKGFDPINVLRCATLNPKTHYNLCIVMSNVCGVYYTKFECILKVTPTRKSETMRTKFCGNNFLGKGFRKTSADSFFLNSDVASGGGGVWGGILRLLLFLFWRNSGGLKKIKNNL